MGTYKISIDKLSDEIYDLLYDLEGDWTLEDLIKACRDANKRIKAWHRKK